MNKTYLIAGGASVVSLAAGAAGGYFFAKKQLQGVTEQRVSEEVEKTKKYFSVLLMEAEKGNVKPENPADVLAAEDPQRRRKYESATDYAARLMQMAAEEEQLKLEAEGEVEELNDIDRRSVEKAAAKAQTNYQGYADKPEVGEIVHHNIFSKEAPKKTLPPRGPGGKFVPAQKAEPEQTPYLITTDEFLQDERGYEQENLVYFKNDHTLLDYSNEEVPIERVGEVSLTLFPETGDTEASIICVRNEGLEIDYEIKLTHESLTEYMGFGESDEDINNDEAESIEV